jgi:hypothetical protein
MAQVIRYIDPDSPGPTHDGTSWNDAYLTFAAWDSAEATDLVSDGDYHTVYTQRSGTQFDTSAEIIGDAWNTGASNYIEVIGNNTDGQYGGAAVLHLSNLSADQHIFRLGTGAGYVRFKDLLFFNQCNANDESIAILVQETGSSDIRIQNCIFRGAITSSTNCYGRGVFLQQNTGPVNIYNSQFFNYYYSGNTIDAGIWNNNGICNVYNCTFYNNYDAIKFTIGGTMVVKNCISFANISDYTGGVGSETLDYNASDDGFGTNSVSPLDSDWDNEVTDKVNFDFRLVPGGNCVEGGVNDPGSGLYSDDIVGTKRT